MQKNENKKPNSQARRKGKPLGKAAIVKEALSNEAATPTEKDIKNARGLAKKISPGMEAMFEAEAE